MEFAELLRVVHDEPVFEAGLLLAADVAPFLQPSADLTLLTKKTLANLLVGR